MPGLDAIRRAPEDDAPRLAYADAIDDPARAALIRLQCALARLDRNDASRPALEVECARVAIDPAWTADLEAAGLVTKKLKPSEPWSFKPPYAFQRGFVEHLFARGDLLVARGAELAEAHPIRSLAVERCTVENARALAKASWFARVERLSTDASRAALSAALAGVASIVRLRVSLGAKGVAEVLRSPAIARLRALTIDLPDDLARGASAIAESAPETIEELDFRSAMSGWGSATGQRSTDAVPAGDALAAMLRSPNLARLESLRLDRMDEAAVDAVASLGALERLRVDRPTDAIAASIVERVAPRLRRLELGHAGALFAARLANASLPRLEALSFGRGIGEPAMPSAAAREAVSSIDAPSLVSLHVASIDLDVALADALDAARVPKLAELTVSAREISSGGVARFVKTRRATQLRTLWIALGKDTLADARAIADADLASLQRLSIANAPSGDDADLAIEALAAARGLPALRHLYFSSSVNHPGFGTRGARALVARAPSELAVLYFNASGLSAAARRDLGARFVVYSGCHPSSDHLPFVARGHLEA